MYYGTLVGVLARIADVVCGELDGLFVEGREKSFGEGDFGHDGVLEARVEGWFNVGLQCCGVSRGWNGVNVLLVGS